MEFFCYNQYTYARAAFRVTIMNWAFTTPAIVNRDRTNFKINIMKLDDIDHYAILGVPRSASAAEIKAAYRRKAKEYHPDTSHRCDADKMFKSLNKAYSVLKDKRKRAEYNLELMAEIFQQEVVDPARKSVPDTIYGYSDAVADDSWGWRVG